METTTKVGFGAVAVQLTADPTVWRAVLHDGDGQSKDLGKDVWDHVRTRIADGDIGEFAEDLLRFDTWDTYLERGFCKYCGKRKGTPIITDTDFLEPGKKYDASEGRPDVDELHHTHHTGDPRDRQLEGFDGALRANAEYLYVVELNAKKMHCYARHSSGRGYVLAHTLNLTVDPPSWDALQRVIVEARNAGTGKLAGYVKMSDAVSTRVYVVTDRTNEELLGVYTFHDEGKAFKVAAGLAIQYARTGVLSEDREIMYKAWDEKRYPDVVEHYNANGDSVLTISRTIFREEPSGSDDRSVQERINEDRGMIAAGQTNDATDDDDDDADGEEE